MLLYASWVYASRKTQSGLSIITDLYLFKSLTFIQFGGLRVGWRLMSLIQIDWDSVSRGYFCLTLCSFEPPSSALVVNTWCNWVQLQELAIRAREGGPKEHSQKWPSETQSQSIWLKLIKRQPTVDPQKWINVNDKISRCRYMMRLW